MWQFTKRHQESLSSGQGRAGGVVMGAGAVNEVNGVNGVNGAGRAGGVGGVGGADGACGVNEAGGIYETGGARAGQGRWSYHPPPWRRWMCLAACVAGMAGGMEAGAQTSSAPFVFEGGVLRIDTPGWVSDRDHVVAAPAYIEVAQGVEAHMRGGIAPAPGSPNGLYKLGGGTLRLSGATTYQGSTRLLQGGLHVDGPSVFTTWGGVEAIAGTRLDYSPGVRVTKSLTLSRADIAQVLPPGLYSPVAPPAGLEDAMGWRVEAGRAEHAGLLQGGLPFAKLGAGLLDISGDAMAYTGQARVMEGALAINEIFSGSVIVGAGARLEGAGSLASAHVQGGGTLAPGSGGDVAEMHAAADGASVVRIGGAARGEIGMGAFNAASAGIGALTVAGGLRFDPGSRFEVEALPTGESDSVWVGGRALLDGEVAVLAQNGVWQPSTSYLILNAQDGFDHTRFAAVSSDLAFLTPSLEYGADSVVLTLKRNDLPIEDVGETPDEKEVGRVIDEEGEDDRGAAGPAPDEGGVVEEQPPFAEAPEIPGLHDGMVGLDGNTARQALRQLTGSWHASVLSSVWDDSRFLREAVLHQSMVMMVASWPGAERNPGRVGGRAFSWEARPSAPSLMASSAAMLSTSSSAMSLSAVSPARVEGASVDASPASWIPWAEVFHSDQQRDGAHGVAGDSRRLDGLMLGVAAAVNAYWKAGAYFGAQRSRLEREQGEASANIETTHAGLHLAGHVAGLRLALGAARSFHRIKSSRFLQAGALRDALGARYGGHTTQVFGEMAWPLWEHGSAPIPGLGVREAMDGLRKTDGGPMQSAGMDKAREAGMNDVGNANVGPVRSAGMDERRVPARDARVEARLTPFIRLAWVRTGMHGFTEDGGPAAHRVEPGSMAAWSSAVGLRAEAAVGASSAGGARESSHGQGRIHAQLAWHYAGVDIAKSTQSFRDSAAQRLFTSQGLVPARQSWSLRLGLDARVGKATDVGFAYLGRYGSGLRDQGIGGWARIAF